jgi:hypothetical protein
LDEYADWYAYGREASLVLLKPFVEERGWDAMPQVLSVAKEATTLEQYWERWGSMPAGSVTAGPEQAVAYFEALLNKEREALRLGRKEAFLMLQDEGWRSWQERYYWLVQEDKALIPSTPIVVHSVQVAGDRARLQLAESLPSIDAMPPQSLGDTVYLTMQEGGWRHASALEGYSWSFPPPIALTLTPTPAPTPTPRAGQGSD